MNLTVQGYLKGTQKCSVSYLVQYYSGQVYNLTACGELDTVKLTSAGGQNGFYFTASTPEYHYGKAIVYLVEVHPILTLSPTLSIFVGG